MTAPRTLRVHRTKGSSYLTGNAVISGWGASALITVWMLLVDRKAFMTTTDEKDSYDAMLAAVAAFHRKHRFREQGGEEMTYRIALMAEELGEIADCVTKGRSDEQLAEEVADLMILLIGTAIARGFDLKAAFWNKMAKLEGRGSRLVDGRIRVSEFRDLDVE